MTAIGIVLTSLIGISGIIVGIPAALAALREYREKGKAGEDYLIIKASVGEDPQKVKFKSQHAAGPKGEELDDSPLPEDVSSIESRPVDVFVQNPTEKSAAIYRIKLKVKSFHNVSDCLPIGDDVRSTYSYDFIFPREGPFPLTEAKRPSFRVVKEDQFSITMGADRTPPTGIAVWEFAIIAVYPDGDERQFASGIWTDGFDIDANYEKYLRQELAPVAQDDETRSCLKSSASTLKSLLERKDRNEDWLVHPSIPTLTKVFTNLASSGSD